MFKEIGLAIRALFHAFTTLFGAFDKGASAVDHLADWANQTAAAFSDEAKMTREMQAIEAAAAQRTTVAALKAAATSSATVVKAPTTTKKVKTTA